MVNAVIGKKKKTWCDNFMLAATLGCVALHSLAPQRIHLAGPGCPLKFASGKAGFCKSGAVVSSSGSPRRRHKKFGLPFAA